MWRQSWKFCLRLESRKKNKRNKLLSWQLAMTMIVSIWWYAYALLETWNRTEKKTLWTELWIEECKKAEEDKRREGRKKRKIGKKKLGRKKKDLNKGKVGNSHEIKKEGKIGKSERWRDRKSSRRFRCVSTLWRSDNSSSCFSSSPPPSPSSSASESSVPRSWKKSSLTPRAYRKVGGWKVFLAFST